MIPANNANTCVVLVTARSRRLRWGESGRRVHLVSQVEAAQDLLLFVVVRRLFLGLLFLLPRSLLLGTTKRVFVTGTMGHESRELSPFWGILSLNHVTNRSLGTLTNQALGTVTNQSLGTVTNQSLGTVSEQLSHPSVSGQRLR